MDSAVHRPLRRLVARIAGTALVVGAVAGGATTASAQGDVLPVPVNQAADAYAWGYSPSTPSYVVTGAYVKNPTGGSTTISRAGTGRYTITFTGMNFARGNVQVTAYGNANVCNVVNWYGATINVACRNPAGAPADSRFSAIYRNASLPAYVWAHSGTTPTYDASSTYSKNPSGRAVTVHRLDVGRYRVVFNGSSIAGGQAHVTAYNSGASCALLSWGGSAADVQCRDTTGRADTALSLSWTNRADVNRAFAYAPATPSYDVAPAWGSNTSGRPITVTRSGVGAYRVQFQGTSLHAGNVQVTPFGDRTRCNIAWWSGDSANVRCYAVNTSIPTDSRFTVSHRP
jgi:hypothetical protein